MTLVSGDLHYGIRDDMHTHCVVTDCEPEAHGPPACILLHTAH